MNNYDLYLTSLFFLPSKVECLSYLNMLDSHIDSKTGWQGHGFCILVLNLSWNELWLFPFLTLSFFFLQKWGYRAAGFKGLKFTSSMQINLINFHAYLSFDFNNILGRKAWQAHASHPITCHNIPGNLYTCNLPYLNKQEWHKTGCNKESFVYYF